MTTTKKVTQVKLKGAKVTPITREYERRVFVRFDAPGKELVRKAAVASGMSPYIAHFASEAARSGRKVPSQPVTAKSAGVFARFDDMKIKRMVIKAAKASGVSLSSYSAHFAVAAAKSGKKMIGQPKTAVA